MTDRVNYVTVFLEENTRDDDIKPLVAAIEQLRGVLKVKINVADRESYIAEARAMKRLRQELWNVLYPKELS
jgi:hypothetical protein